MKKLIRDGKVGVLVSPGFGAGWSTWAAKEDIETLCMDADIVQAVVDGNKVKAGEIAATKCPEAYLGGLEDLEVVWLVEGTMFEINEYDGNESLHVIGRRRYMTA